jgi:PKD domain
MGKCVHWAVFACWLCGVSLAGCLEDETLRTNVAPIANAGEDQQLDYGGEPVTVRLDGRKSSDRDGEIVEYIWRSAQPGGDGGSQWASGVLDPDDEERPSLELDRGSYTFVLWVSDDHGGVSKPDSVNVEVGTDPLVECVAESLELVPEPCRACSCGGEEGCIEATVACREDCWNLVQCIVEQGCASSDINCIVAGCADFLGGATPAMAISPCVTPCADACAGDSGGDGG